MISQVVNVKARAVFAFVRVTAACATYADPRIDQVQMGVTGQLGASAVQLAAWTSSGEHSGSLQ